MLAFFSCPRSADLKAATLLPGFASHSHVQAASGLGRQAYQPPRFSSSVFDVSLKFQRGRPQISRLASAVAILPVLPRLSTTHQTSYFCHHNTRHLFSSSASRSSSPSPTKRAERLSPETWRPETCPPTSGFTPGYTLTTVQASLVLSGLFTPRSGILFVGQLIF